LVNRASSNAFRAPPALPRRQMTRIFRVTSASARGRMTTPGKERWLAKAGNIKTAFSLRNEFLGLRNIARGGSDYPHPLPAPGLSPTLLPISCVLHAFCPLGSRDLLHQRVTVPSLEKGLSTGNRSTCPLIGKNLDLPASAELKRLVRGKCGAAKFSHRENIRTAKERADQRRSRET
jgi:hypothetical protein